MQNELYLEWSSFCKMFLFLMNDFYWIIYHHTEWVWCPWLGRFWSSGPRSAWSWSDAWSLWPLGSVINSICSYCSSCGLSPFSYPPVCVHYTWIFHLTSELVSYRNVLRGFSFKFTSYLWTRCTVSFNYGLYLDLDSVFYLCLASMSDKSIRPCLLSCMYTYNYIIK